MKATFYFYDTSFAELDKLAMFLWEFNPEVRICEVFVKNWAKLNFPNGSSIPERGTTYETAPLTINLYRWSK